MTVYADVEKQVAICAEMVVVANVDEANVGIDVGM